MAELPEIETIRRGLEREVVGRRIKSADVTAAKLVRRNGSKKAFTSQVEGKKIKSVERRGFLLVVTLDSGDLVVIDIGETGRLARATAKDPASGDVQLVLSFTQGGQLRLLDPEGAAEVFVVTPDGLEEELPDLAELGLDPVAGPVSWTSFAHALIARRHAKLKQLMLDPTFVVGLGGLYADEILYGAGLRPDRDVSTVSTMEIRRLYRTLVEVLHDATKHHGTSTEDRPFTDLHGNPGGYQSELSVWGRDGTACQRCRGTVTKQRSGGRFTYWCPGCQV